MRFWTVATLAAALCGGCASNAPDLPEPAASTGAAQLLSTVHTADALAEPQLVEGFYPVEQGAWRWTAKSFTVSLAAPPPVAGEPANLELKFTIPQVSIDNVGALTLSAEVNGTPVGEETYSEAGEFLFSRPVPTEALAGKEAAQAVFTLDKVMAPGGGDDRALGVVATSVSLR